jgi:hypothetical protein
MNRHDKVCYEVSRNLIPAHGRTGQMTQSRIARTKGKCMPVRGLTRKQSSRRASRAMSWKVGAVVEEKSMYRVSY